MRILILTFFASLFMVACQQAPTKVYQTSPTQTKEGAGKGEIQLSPQTVIVDARPAFEYSVSHLNGSILLRPEDFNQKEEKFRGLLDLDHFTLARRLARLGIGPETPVVVVGRGVQGHGEEGRVAWTFKRLGLHNVRFAAIDYFSIPLSSAEAPPRENVAIWKPEEDESLEVTRTDFLKAVVKPKSPAVGPIVIIDVRPSEEYLGKVSSSQVKTPPDIGAVNIPWTHFFRQNGLLNESVKSKLEAIGITTDKTIYVVANQGQESAAVTLALREMGYAKAANFAGGYVELMAGKK